MVMDDVTHMTKMELLAEAEKYLTKLYELSPKPGALEWHAMRIIYPELCKRYDAVCHEYVTRVEN